MRAGKKCLAAELQVREEWLIEPRGKFASVNQMHYPDLGFDASSVWNFCAGFSDAILQGNSWWHREMLPLFSS